MKVSIVMPAYNAASFIGKSIESVLSQTYEDWELLIIDDASSDGTSEIIKEYSESDSRVFSFSQVKNMGAAEARNLGIRHASGKYIAFLDSDDFWYPDKLEKQVSFIRKSGSPFVFSAYQKVDEHGNKLGVIGVPEKVSYNELLKSCVIGCLTVIYDVDALGKVYMPLIRKRQDFGLWLRILKLTPYAYGQNIILAEYTVRENSISSRKNSAAAYQWKLYRDVEKLSVLKSAYYFSHYAVRGVLRQRYPDIARALGVLK
ncbi:hypothetical protein L861_02015 [Litchfieldella anticariensis FP35 = DSM 16096]|uniref:Glycosyltransferase 2-like domain-containing protein n=1 Tax=Litchfieldella anticariensis (strain DSM 16096 / CECT 5854 / CIP 108499 / LMG 22089 / FP35) TaxID=1121939 RepID=S2KU63_LITA3|nr:glycosyltransferase family 2 protein [Halomonas anticariensis]EPC04108.1 hypothetical protein L861_02015 [Halomonas anticariensis FP35 = DSM 16096]